MSYDVLLVVSFVNAGGQPTVVQRVLRARAEALAEQEGVTEGQRKAAQEEADVAESPLQEVARFQRVLSVPVPLTAGVGLVGVGPQRFNPGQVYFSLQDRRYEAVEVVQLCHSSGDCACQQDVKAYMNDDRWEMIADIYASRAPDNLDG